MSVARQIKKSIAVMLREAGEWSEFDGPTEHSVRMLKSGLVRTRAVSSSSPKEEGPVRRFRITVEEVR